MLKIRNHCYSAISLLVLLGWMVVAPAPATAQVREAKLGTYDEATRIFTCTDGGFQISFLERPKETLENTTKNEIPAFEGYDFGDEKGIGISGDEAIIAMTYSESAQLESTSVSEQRKLADALFKSLEKPGRAPDKTLTRREIKVPGTSFAVEYTATKEVAPSDFEEGGSREFRMRILIAGKTFYTIFVAADSDAFDIPEIAQFADSFKLLNVPEGDAPQMPALESSTKSGLANFTFAKDGFSMKFPAKPNESQSELLKTDFGEEFIQTYYTVETASGSYLVSVQGSTFDPVAQSAEVQQSFDSLETRIAASLSGEVVSRKDLVIGRSIPGREAVVSIPERRGIYRVRLFYANNRFYQLVVDGPAEFSNSDEADEFFQSFKFLNEPESDAPQAPVKNSDTSKTGLTKFTSAEGGFSILLPSEPKKVENEIADPTGKNKIQTQFLSETSSGAYLVSHEPIRGFVLDKPELVALAFQLVRDGLLKQLKGDLLSEEDVQLGRSFPGRKYRITIPEAAGEYRTEIFLVGEKLLQVVAVGATEFANSKETDDIFKSFRLLDDASKSAPETDLIEYSSALGGFNARLPAKPVYSRRTEKDGNGREHIQHRYLCDSDNSAVLISVTEFNGLCQNSDAQLHTMCESFVRGMAGKNQVEQFVRVQSDVNPHEWAFRHIMPEPGVKVQGRVVIANDRFYIVQAIGDAEYLSNSSTNDVVQSLGIMTVASKE